MGGKVMGQPYPCGRDEGYFDIRDCWVDYRGKLDIHPTAEFGFEVMLITASHHPNLFESDAGPMHRTTVRVKAKAWVANRAILYSCEIGEHATVGAGAVVKGVVIPGGTLAEGNPAMIVAWWDGDHWRRFSEPIAPSTFRESVD